MRTGCLFVGRTPAVRLTFAARLALAALVACSAAGDRAAGAKGNAEAAPRPIAGGHPVGNGAKHLTLFYTGEIHGTLEPCGCTSDPFALADGAKSW